MVKDVLVEIRGSSVLVEFFVIDMDPHRQTSIILWKPFLESVSADIDEKQGTIRMEVNGQHEKFTFHPMDPTSFYQAWSLYQKGPDEIKHVEVLPYAPECPDQQGSSQKK